MPIVKKRSDFGGDLNKVNNNSSKNQLVSVAKIASVGLRQDGVITDGFQPSSTTVLGPSGSDASRALGGNLAGTQRLALIRGFPVFDTASLSAVNYNFTLLIQNSN